MDARTVVTGTEILSYKFFAPKPNAGAIRRDGILRKLSLNQSANIFLIHGPAGHGKSTALQQLQTVAESEGDLTGWLTFDAGDNDPRRFFIHFQALVNGLQRRAGDETGAIAPARDANDYHHSDRTIDRLLTIGPRVSLFLDEFQTLNDKMILTFFKNLFERVPESLKIYVGSRSLPDVGLARLVVNGRALILHGDDLRFTPYEVEQFFAASGDLGIDLDEIDAIYHRTEGWPAALQLFRLTLGSPSVRRSLGDANARAPRELAEYLAENVLALQSPSVQSFLLQTSLLTRLSGPLCNTVLCRTDSDEVLQNLERSGLFLRCVDPQVGWFKYHTLFSSILADQVRLQSPEKATAVHRSAASWFIEHRYFEDAVHHAVSCEEFALAADALNLWSSHLVAGAHLRTVEHWSARVPLTEIAARPDLAIKCVYALVFLRKRQRAKPLLDILSQLPRTGNVRNSTDPKVALFMAAVCADGMPGGLGAGEKVPLRPEDCNEFAAFELGAAANLRACCALAVSDFEAARQQLAVARIYNDRIDAAFSRGYTIAVSGVALLLQGFLRDALEKFREGLTEERSEAHKSFASAALYSCYVWALYEANELDAAELQFTRYRDIISESTLPDFLTVAYVSMARLHDARGRPVKGEAILDEAEAIARNNGWSRLVSIVNWERVRRSLLRGSTQQAVSEAQSARIEQRLPAGWIPFSNDVDDQEFGEIRLALAELNLDEAARRLENEFKRQRGRVLRQIRLHLLMAVHALQVDNHGSARRSLRVALRLAQPGRFIRAFLDERAEILQLVREEYQGHIEAGGGSRRQSPERDFLELLLQASGTDTGGGLAAAQATMQPLTDREREMLVLLANGSSNKDMATTLYVSENTVKFHLKNIYAKLSVTSRVQATTAARQIGILR
jgi:LuxR family transcriptional regulator, maltose regulon positive regulatory protein